MSTQPQSTSTLTLSKALSTGLAIAAAVGFLSGGFSLGVLAANGFTHATTAGSALGTTTPSTAPATGGTSTAAFAVGNTHLLSSSVTTLQGQATTLAQGSKGTVVVAMASWCLFCGYEDKWVMPQLAKTPGVVIDVVDVSPQGGIADPGPENPPFSGHDGTGSALTLTQMESTMQQYATTYGTLSASNIHVYVAPSATQSAWNIQSFPTLAFLNSAGKIAVAPQGAQTVSQAQSDLQQALNS